MAHASLRVAVAGARGKMGKVTVEAVRQAPDLEYVGALVRGAADASRHEFAGLQELVTAARPDVLVDFTLYPGSKEIALGAIERGVRPVIGTSGYAETDLAELRAACERRRVGAVLAANFAVGAVLMLKFAEAAARHYRVVEIVEMHEAGKKDAPSGTAMATARRLARAGTFERPPTAALKAEGARGASLNGVGVHSLRVPGVVAHQEVLFGGDGETLRIVHDSTSRASFMPGVLLAVRAAAGLQKFVEGLEELL